MSIITVWHHFFQPDHPFSPDPVLRALAAAGVVTRELEAEEVAGPGLVFFHEVTPRLCAFIRDASRGGVERLLAIALSDRAMADEAAWRVLRAGASDVLPWHRHAAPALEAASRFERWEAVDRLVDSPIVRDNLIGRSAPWIAALRQVAEAARFTSASVLILGETGTGKELVARLIHALDARQRKGDLVVLDCTTVAPELAGSEFFGHERGAFTGAVAMREGSFALADGGTLFLDEIGELPPILQAELLRAIQERSYKRVGGNVWRTSDFRLLCASNRELAREVEEGAFRRDLYHRIAGATCTLPPLRDRPDDILPLVRHFLQELRPTLEPPELDEPVRNHLLTRPYPGNVRDLRQLVTRIASRHVGPGPITMGDIPPEERPAAEVWSVDWRDAAFESAIRRAVARGVGLREIGHAATETAISIAVSDEGNLQRAARKLGVTDRALQMRRAARRQGPAADEEERA
jgi:transcriptional regulator with GAF, ATPase, and Fis domain